ncbi:MAG: hypothetical protein ACI8RZ_000268 [Myxococcota bacterium]|jgi:hypothetical protein
MSLSVETVSLIRKTNISLEDAEAFLVLALQICAGEDEAVEWQQINKVERGRGLAVERTLTHSWQGGGMLDVRRTQVLSFKEGLEGEELKSSRTTYDLRGFPDEGRLDYRIDNTRLKGASMEVYCSPEAATSVAALFRETFSE